MYKDNIIGKRLKEARKVRNLTQRQLKELSGVSATTISFIETGYRVSRVDVLCRLADALQISMDWLLGRSISDTWENMIINLSEKDTDIIKYIVSRLSHNTFSEERPEGADQNIK